MALASLALAASTDAATTFPFTFDGPVYAIQRVSDTLYVGGSFDTVLTAASIPTGAASGSGAAAVLDKTERHGLAAFDLSTGALLPWNPSVGGAVLALRVDGPTAYVGGGFFDVGGTPRQRLAAIEVSTGALLPWNPGANGLVLDMEKVGSTLYVGGQFDFIGGATQKGVAAIDASTGTLLPWNPGVGHHVWDLDVVGGTMYLGGSFSTIGGESRPFVAAVDLASALPTSWAPEVDYFVSQIEVHDGSVFLAGLFSTVGTETRNGLAAVDQTTGMPTAWSPGDLGLVGEAEVYAMAVSGSTLYIGGKFSSIGAEGRDHLAAIDVGTGALDAWNPGANQQVRELLPDAGTVWVGGWFTQLDGEPRGYFGSVDAPIVVSAPAEGSAAGFALEPVRPNPSTRRAHIAYAMPREAHVRIEVVDLQGRRLATLVDAIHPAGRHEASWDDRAARPGLYVVRFEASGVRATRKLLRIE